MKFTEILEQLTEGSTKRALEAKVEKACTCGGGASLDPNDHKKNCPAQKYLKDDYGMSDEIDRAEYSKDR